MRRSTLLVLLLAACSSGPARPVTAPLAARLMALTPATGTDTVAVWVCHVPLDTTDPTYERDGLRLALTPDEVVRRAAPRLEAYVAAISHGQYRVHLVPGGEVTMAASDTSHDCADRALDASTSADVVLAVADAEHTATAAGGWGTPGARFTCHGTCPASATRRAAYVGASDFHPDWGPVPALDLMEHELGHTLGLPHSASTAGPGGEQGLASALDVMSDSAAPRAADPTRLDGPDVLAIDRLALGWLPLRDVVTAPPGGATTVGLAVSTGDRGVRLLLLPIDDHRVLTVEHLAPIGFDAHLPVEGVAVHLVDDTVGQTIERRQDPLVGVAPFTGLLTAGGSWQGYGWSVRVTSITGGTAQVAVGPTEG